MRQHDSIPHPARPVLGDNHLGFTGARVVRVEGIGPVKQKDDVGVLARDSRIRVDQTALVVCRRAVRGRG